MTDDAGARADETRSEFPSKEGPAGSVDSAAALASIGSVGIIGLGLIGGSLARDLARRGVRVTGWDDDPETVARAHAERVIVDEPGYDLSGLSAVRATVIAVPVDAAITVLRRAAPHVAGHQLVTDVGSTKRTIGAEAARLGLHNFVGSHPLAGDHRSGWSAARTGLFDGALVYLCADDTAGEAAMRAAHALWHGVGARTEAVDADAHDRLLARTSHLPQLLSSALSLSLGRALPPETALGTGARGMLRLAHSDAAMWQAILGSNAEHVRTALAELRAVLDEYAAALDAADAQALRALLSDGRAAAAARTSRAD